MQSVSFWGAGIKKSPGRRTTKCTKGHEVHKDFSAYSNSFVLFVILCVLRDPVTMFALREALTERNTQQHKKSSLQAAIIKMSICSFVNYIVPVAERTAIFLSIYPVSFS